MKENLRKKIQARMLQDIQRLESALQEAEVNGVTESLEDVEQCTGLTATWCPIHGDCRCPRNEFGDRTFDGSGCPLHAIDSSHPLPPAKKEEGP